MSRAIGRLSRAITMITDRNGVFSLQQVSQGADRDSGQVLSHDTWSVDSNSPVNVKSSVPRMKAKMQNNRETRKHHQIFSKTSALIQEQSTYSYPWKPPLWNLWFMGTGRVLHTDLQKLLLCQLTHYLRRTLGVQQIIEVVCRLVRGMMLSYCREVQVCVLLSTAGLLSAQQLPGGSGTAFCQPLIQISSLAQKGLTTQYPETIFCILQLLVCSHWGHFLLDFPPQDHHKCWKSGKSPYFLLSLGPGKGHFPLLITVGVCDLVWPSV